MTSFNPPATRETLFETVVQLHTKQPVLQQEISWFPERWKIGELEIFLPQVEKLQKLCRKAAEKSLITRQDVLDHSQQTPDLFISSMIFGHGDGGLGPTRVARISAATGWDTVFERLEGQFRESVNGPSASWKSHTNTHRVKYFGPAFATKFAYFSAVKQRCGTDLPLIADANTSWAIWWITQEVSRSVERHDGYVAYVRHCHDWGIQFTKDCGYRVTPDEIERALFVLGTKWPKTNSSAKVFRVQLMADDIKSRRSRAGEFAARRRWTDDEKRSRAVARTLSKTPSHKMTITDLLTVLATKEGILGPWNRENLRKAVQWSEKKFHSPKKAKAIRSYLKLEKGGRAVIFVKNSGRHSRGTGIVGECVKAFGKEALPRAIARVIGANAATRAEAFDVHSGTREGKWSSPDFAAAFFRGRSSKPFALHCFEVQERVGNPKRVNIPQEIAQSFVCSKGYNRCWFMLHRDTWDSIDQIQRDRAERLAGRLGVGIITYEDPRSGTTWRRVRKAAELDYVSSPQLMYRNLLKRAQA